MKLQTVMTKIKNAFKLIRTDGFGAFWHKTKRLVFHKHRALSRKLFHPKAGLELREEAKKYFAQKSEMFKLSIVIPVLGQHDITRFCLNKIIENKVGEIEIIVIDNGGDFEIKDDSKLGHLKILKPSAENIGVYPTFKLGMENTKGDVVLFIHSDLIIDERGFDLLLTYVFASDKEVGLVGFIGSDEINENGGRSSGTTSNFLGKTYKYKDRVWTGTPASMWGERYDGLTSAVVLDGCSMALRRSAWNEIGYRENRPLNHYYDRLISLQVLEAKYKVKVLGIACDHISGQTAMNEKKYFNTAQIWCTENNIAPIKNHLGNIDWDMSMHEEAKRLFLKEWKDEKKKYSLFGYHFSRGYFFDKRSCFGRAVSNNRKT